MKNGENSITIKTLLKHGILMKMEKIKLLVLCSNSNNVMIYVEKSLTKTCMKLFPN